MENPDATATITAIGTGNVALRASVDSVSSSDLKTVPISDSLQGLEVSPATATISVGGVGNFTATGIYTTIDDQGATVAPESNRRVAVTDSVAWAITAGTEYATVVKGQVTGESAGASTLTASCADQEATSNITVQVATSGTATSLSFDFEGEVLIVPLGTTSELRVSTGSTYAESRNVTNEVEWSFNPEIDGTFLVERPMVIDGDDFATIRPLRAGTVDITALRRGFAATVKVRITD